MENKIYHLIDTQSAIDYGFYSSFEKAEYQRYAILFREHKSFDCDDTRFKIVEIEIDRKDPEAGIANQAKFKEWAKKRLDYSLSKVQRHLDNLIQMEYSLSKSSSTS